MNSNLPSAVDVALQREMQSTALDVLYYDAKTAIMGMVASIGAVAGSAYHGGSNALWACAAGLTLVAIARTVDFRLFSHAKRNGFAVDGSTWEFRYFLGAFFFMAGLGAAGYAGFTTIPYELHSVPVYLALFGALFSQLVGIIGRNYSNPTIIRFQIGAMIVPLAGGVWMLPGIEYKIVAIMAVPSAFAGIRVATRSWQVHREKQEKAAENIRLAQFDTITGLFNRGHMATVLDSAVFDSTAANDRFAVHYIDLDRFKQVNDRYGHPAGDELLWQFGSRLREIVGPEDSVSRFAGDEFVILQRGAGADAARRLAGDIVKRTSEVFDIRGVKVNVGASVGISLFPQHGRSAEDLLHDADTALYAAKEEGRNRFRLFDAAMEDRLQARQKLEDDLKAAVDNRLFDVHFQPIVDIRTGRVAYCEALLRWEHEGRFIPPLDFIPRAEELGLLGRITDIVLDKACSAAASWPSHIGVSVNVTPDMIMNSDVPAMIAAALSRTGLQPSRLEIEITETILLDDNARVQGTLNVLKRMGVSLALDDFGTGYSSLSYLPRFDVVDKVKIDKSFLKGLGEDEKATNLMIGVAQLCARMGFAVVIEGVEEQRQLDLVKEAGAVTYVQGYIFSKPRPLASLASYLMSEKAQVAPAETATPSRRLAIVSRR